MAVQTTASEVTHSGNGAATVFAVPFKFLSAESLQVSLDGVLQGPGAYAVAGAGADVGGTVTFLAAPAAGVAVHIARETDVLQPVVLTTQGPFQPATLMRAFDKLTLLAQENRGKVLALLAALAAVTALVQEHSTQLAEQGERLGALENRGDYLSLDGGTLTGPLVAQAVTADSLSVAGRLDAHHLYAPVALGDTGGELKLETQSGALVFHSNLNPTPSLYVYEDSAYFTPLLTVKGGLKLPDGTVVNGASDLGGDKLPLGGGTLTGQLALAPSGLKFSDDTTLTTVPSFSGSAVAFFGATSFAVSTGAYLFPASAHAVAAGTEIKLPWPATGTLRGIYFAARSSTATLPVSVTLRINGVASAAVVSLAPGALEGQLAGLNIPLTAGDGLSVVMTATGAGGTINDPRVSLEVASSPGTATLSNLLVKTGDTMNGPLVLDPGTSSPINMLTVRGGGLSNAQGVVAAFTTRAAAPSPAGIYVGVQGGGSWFGTTSGNPFDTGLMVGQTVRFQVSAGATGAILRQGLTVNGTGYPTEALEVNGNAKLSGWLQFTGTGASKVACAAAVRGRVWFTQGATGIADAAEVCTKSAADTYGWTALAGAGGGGVTDHGALTGLADNDHPQYVLKAGDTLTGSLTMPGFLFTGGGAITRQDADSGSFKQGVNFFNPASNGWTWTSNGTSPAGIDGGAAYLSPSGDFSVAKSLQFAGTGSSKPVCGVTHRGKLWFMQEVAGVADTVEVCKKTAADSYAWVAL